MMLMLITAEIQLKHSNKCRPYKNEFLEDLIDEDQGNERGKNLFSKSRDVLDEETSLDHHNNDCNCCNPKTDPETE